VSVGILVEQGERVTRSQCLAIVEAMKMECTLQAQFDGAVSEISVVAEAQVAEGAKVMTTMHPNAAYLSDSVR
jgi:biotin carboxyl carrier protein